MKAIYEYANYKDFLNDRISQFPNNGRGVSSRLSKFIGVSAVMVSQVLNGNRNFSRDKLYLTTLFFEMNELDREYILNLFDSNQSKCFEHINYLQKRLERIKSEIQKREALTFSATERLSSEDVSYWSAPGIEKTYP